MNLYGRPMEQTIDPDADCLPLLDASATGDENQLRDITVTALRQATALIIQIAGTTPTTTEIPAGTYALCRNSAGSIHLWYNYSGTLTQLA